MSRRLLNFEGMRRIPANGWIAGVCAGVAEYYNWNVRLLRLILVITFICSGFFPIVVVYLLLWYLLEEGAPGSSFDPAEGVPAPPAPPGMPATPAGSTVRAPSLREVQTRFAKLDERLRNIEECVTEREFDLRRELKKLES